MADQHRAWALIVLPSEERQYQGNVGYKDDPRTVYRYDSSVANHLQVAEGDVVLLRDRTHLLGVAVVEEIRSGATTKLRSRCPQCGSVALKYRKTLTPPYRCANGHEFGTPKEEVVQVVAYEAHYANTFVAAKGGVTVDEVKAAAFRPSDQMSIEELDLRLLEPHLLEGTPKTAALLQGFHQSRGMGGDEGLEESEGDPSGIGEFNRSIADSRDSVLRSIKARRGQRGFRRALVRRYGPKCMVSGCALMDIVEAAHIWPYRGNEDNHPENGLLLRSDLHTLFDLNMMAVEPDTLKVRLSPPARAAGYEHLDGKEIEVARQGPPSSAVLRLRWDIFKRVTQEEAPAK